MAAAAKAATTVCVTGGSGFLGAHVVKQLLARGYTVRATVRDVTNAAKTAHLTALAGAAERLTLHAAELGAERPFHEVTKGVDVIFHTASPCFMGGTEDDTLRPAVAGAASAMEAAKANGVGKVVMTGSMAAVSFDGGKRGDAHTYTADDWSDEQYMADGKMWYPLSKYRAEREAWRLATEHGTQLAVILPTLIIGEMLQPSVNMSNSLVLSFLGGGRKAKGRMSYVDVADAAEAHVAAYEKDAWGKRYVTMTVSAPLTRVAATLAELYPAAGVDTTPADPDEVVELMRFDNAPFRALLSGEPKSLVDMLRSTVNSALAHGHASGFEPAPAPAAANAEAAAAQ